MKNLVGLPNQPTILEDFLTPRIFPWIHETNGTNQLPELGWEISTKMPQVKLFLGWDPNEP